MANVVRLTTSGRLRWSSEACAKEEAGHQVRPVRLARVRRRFDRLIEWKRLLRHQSAASARPDRSHRPPSTTSVTPVTNADGVRTEKESRGRDLVDRRHATERTELLDLLPRRVRCEPTHAFRAVDGTRRQTVHAHAGWPPLGRERSRERIDAGLRRRGVRLSDRAEELQASR